MRGWIKMRPQDKWNAGSCDELRVNFGSRGDYPGCPGYPLKRRFREISSSALSRARSEGLIQLNILASGMLTKQFCHSKGKITTHEVLCKL